MKKISVVKQLDITDCGPCCLQCIIKYYDGYVPLEKIREDCCTTKEGTSAYHLIEAAKLYGFDSIGVNSESLDEDNLYWPAIAHLNLTNGLNHFVVVYKTNENDVWLMDPAKGKVKMSKDEFNKIWSHVLILLTPANSILHLAKNLTLGKLFGELFLANHNLVWLILLVNIILMFVLIVCPFYFQIAVSSIEKRSDLNLLKFVALLFLGLTILKIILSYLKNYYLNYLSKNIDTTIFTSFLNHLFNLPLKFMQNRTSGEVISRIEELNEVKNLVEEIFTNLVLNVILLLASIIVLYFLSAKLFFVLCLIACIYLLIGLFFQNLIDNYIKTNLDATTSLNTTLLEHINMFTSIKNLNLVSPFYQRLESKLIKMLKSNFQLTSFLNKIELLKELVYELGVFLIMTYGIYLILKQRLLLLSLITFQSLLSYFFGSLKDIFNLIPKYSYLKISFNKLSEFLNLEEENLSVGLKKYAKAPITLKNVSFSYNKINYILKNLNFTIKPGTKVLLKGVSGKGKSTLCKLLNRELENYIGGIFFNEINEQDYSLESIRSSLTYVGQEEQLFSGTIKENILAFRKLPDKELLKILKICQIEEIIKNKPMRLESIINPALNNLSGGEKQRIILARALIKKSQIMILDEALSEVNLEMEKSIIKSIMTNFPNLTLIYISHKDVANLFNTVIEVGGLNEAAR